MRSEFSSSPILRVATYNIHKGVTSALPGLRKQVRIHDLKTRLPQLDADLLCLQEVQGRHERHAERLRHWPSEPQAEYLAKALGYHSAYGRAATYLHGDHGNALLSRLPIKAIRHRDVSDHVLERRAILHCEIDWQGLSVHCFVVHLGLFAGSRVRQVNVLAAWIRQEVPESAPLLIAGDFNDWRNVLSARLEDALGVREVFDAARPNRLGDAVNAVERRLDALGVQTQPLTRAARLLKRSRAARTFPSFMPLMHLDRIYVRGLNVLSARVVTGSGWERLSDHAPLLAELTLANPPRERG